jgi:hypothetical protein
LLDKVDKQNIYLFGCVTTIARRFKVLYFIIHSCRRVAPYIIIVSVWFIGDLFVFLSSVEVTHAFLRHLSMKLANSLSYFSAQLHRRIGEQFQKNNLQNLPFKLQKMLIF